MQEVSGSIPLGSTIQMGSDLPHAGLRTAAFCASGAHDQQVAPLRFSKSTILAPAWAKSEPIWLTTTAAFYAAIEYLISTLVDEVSSTGVFRVWRFSDRALEW